MGGTAAGRWRPGRGKAAAVCLAAVVAAAALLLVQQDALPAPGALLSRRMAARAIKAERSLDNFWHGVDARDARTARKVQELQRERLQSGVGTRFESEEAEQDLRTAADWGKGVRAARGAGGAAAAHPLPGRAPRYHGAAHARPQRHSQAEPVHSATGADGISARFFRAAAKHPRAARKAIQEEVEALARQYAHEHRHADKARVEELADGSALDAGSKALLGKAMVRQADKGLLGSSLTGLVRNVFGGPKSQVSKYAAQHHAKPGTYRWSALGEPHWDANGDPIVSQRAANDHGLAGAGIKTTNTLKELYKDTGAAAKGKRQVSDQGNMHLVRLMDNLLYGKRVHRHAARELRAEKAKEINNFSRKLAEHKFDDKMLVDKQNSFFSDKESADAKEPNAGLVLHALEPEAETSLPDQSPVAKKLKDNEMLISGNKGFFKDVENPLGKVVGISAAQPGAARHESEEPEVQVHEQKIKENAHEVRELEARRAADAAKRGAEDMKDFKVVHAVQKQTALDVEHGKDVRENQRLARHGDLDSFFSGVNGQEHHTRASSGQRVKARAAAPHQRAGDGFLARAEQAVVSAEMREKQAERKVRREEQEQAHEREEVLKMERREERKGEAQAAKEIAEREARERRVEEARARRVETARGRTDKRVEAVRAAGVRVAAGQVLEAREVPAKSGKLTEMHVSGDQERQAVAGYFEKLEKQDSYKHKLAVSVIHREEKPRVVEHAYADGSDLRDTERDDKFFEKMALHDENKAKRSSEKRIQRSKDERSLEFYEAAVGNKPARTRRASRTNARVPRAYKEWEHAEKALDDPKPEGLARKQAQVASVNGAKAGGAHEGTRVAGAQQPQSARTAVVKSAVARQGGEHAALQSAALQAQIKAAISSAIQKDVVPELGEEVKHGIKKALGRRAAASSQAGGVAASSPSLPAAAKPAPAAPPAAVARGVERRARDRQAAEPKATAQAPYASQYQYQKRHLAKVLDTPEPSAKAQLDRFLHHPVSTVESLF